MTAKKTDEKNRKAAPARTAVPTERWRRLLAPRSLEEHGLAGYQDRSVWEKTAGREHPD